MMKRLLATLLIFLLLVVSGCDLSLFEANPQAVEPSRDPYQYLDEFRNNWQYKTLNDNEKLYYGHLYTAVKEAENQDSTIAVTDETGATILAAGVRVDFPNNAALSDQRMTALFEAFFRDNPQFFYLSRTYYLEGQSSANTYNTLILQFLLDLHQRQTASARLDDAIQAILATCPVSSDEYERELYLHNQLAKICVYDEAAASLNDDIESYAYTAYGALVDGYAVCEGYAKAMQLLLHKANMEATVISGNSLTNGEAHMWNLVKINGDTYHLDPTWNDNDSHLQHTYFNLTTEMITATHKIAPEQPAVLDCTATKDNYFIRNGTYIDTYERQVIAEVIAQQVINGNEVIQLKFVKGKLANGQLFLKNRSLVYEKVNPYLADKGLSLWEYHLWVNEEQQVLTLTK